MSKSKQNFSKDELEKLYTEYKSYRLAGQALGISKVIFRQQYLKSHHKCISCAVQLDIEHKYVLCNGCLSKNQVDEKPSSKKCEYCDEVICRVEGQSKLSWSKKKGCENCLHNLYSISLKKTQNKYKARYNKAIRINPKTKEYQLKYRNSETGKLNRKVSGARRRAAKVATSSKTVDLYLKNLLLDSTQQCPYCSSKYKLSIDHINPLSRGGTHTEGNIELICLDCNIRKGNKTKNEYLEYLNRIKE